MGEIVVPDMDTPDNHRRLGEIRAGELERAMGHLGRDRVGEPRLPRLGHDGSTAATTTRAASGRPTSTRRPAGWSGSSAATSPTSMTTYNDFGGYGHPDHIRTHDVAVRAFDRAGDPAWYPEQLDGTGARDRGRRRSSTSRPSRPRCASRWPSGWRRSASASWWEPPEDATPEQVAEFEAFAAKMLVPDEAITTWIDISARRLDAKWAAIHEHVTQIGADSPFMLLGLEAGARPGRRRPTSCASRGSRPTLPETDLFAGIV